VIRRRNHSSLYVCIAAALGCGCALFRHAQTAAPGAERGAAHGLGKPAVTASSRPDSVQTASDSAAQKNGDAPSDAPQRQAKLSPASALMIQACDNYIAVNPGSPKLPEVLTIKGSVYYNNGFFPESRAVYSAIIDSFPKSPYMLDAVRMVAQTHFQEKNFDKAQEWYRRMRDAAGEGVDKQEASARIAQSIFKMAEQYENQQRFEDAAAQYERVAMEFPDAVIADAALFNAGNAYEKLTDWTHAILVYQRLSQKYEASKLLPKTKFRIAKCFEKLLQWEQAAATYLHLVKDHPASELTEAALYNAGFCFENANKLIEAAVTFEKLAMSFPNSKDAPDVLFRAGEIYGTLKDWPNVTRVNQEFSRRYGGDINRVVQAQCMIGTALFMQGKHGDAVSQLEAAIGTYRKLPQPSDVNRFYAAKAQYTIGEIYHEQQNAITLVLPKSQYRKLLDAKSELLDKAVAAYSKVVQYKMSEWTTRSIYQLGQICEDFAVGIFKQERPMGLPLDEHIALELGIANAVEEYFVKRALSYHEQNVKLGIKEKLEDKHVLNSKQKLTYLPYVAGSNFLALVDIVEKAASRQQADGFGLIAQKLRILQKIAPFQERAIALFTKALEMGSMYHEKNEFYAKSARLITKTSFVAGETYASVAAIARDAPIPSDFDAYEQFVYKIKLLDQIKNYEDNALTQYVKTMKIADAYTIEDEYVEKTKESLPKLLFFRGRCYDLLCINAFTRPPYPAGITEAEREEYAARFQETGLRLQENAFDFYRAIIEYEKQGYAAGEFVNHAYVRLYQNFPEEFGRKKATTAEIKISSGPDWKCATELTAGWEGIEFDDGQWYKARKIPLPDSVKISGFPAETPVPMWLYKGGIDNPANILSPPRVFFRRTFYLTEPPLEATLYCTAISGYSIFLNGKELTRATDTAMQWHTANSWDLAGRLRAGKNTLAVAVSNPNPQGPFGLMPYLFIKTIEYEHMPVFPGSDEPIDKKIVAEGNWVFPYIKNFDASPADQSAIKH